MIVVGRVVRPVRQSLPSLPKASMNLRSLMSSLPSPADTLRAKWRIGNAVRSFEVRGRLPYGAKVCERVSRELGKSGVDVSKREVERCARFAREFTEEDVEVLIREGVSWSSLKKATGVSQLESMGEEGAEPVIASKPVRPIETWNSEDYDAFRAYLRGQPCVVCGKRGDILLKSWPRRRGERWQVVPICGCEEWTHATETRVIRRMLKRYAEIVGDCSRFVQLTEVGNARIVCSEH